VVNSGTLVVGLNGNTNAQVLAGGSITAHTIEIASGEPASASLNIDSGAMVTSLNDVSIGGPLAHLPPTRPPNVTRLPHAVGTTKVWTSAGVAVKGSGIVNPGRLELAGGSATVAAGASINIGVNGFSSDGADITLTPGPVPGTMTLAGNVSYTGNGSNAAMI